MADYKSKYAEKLRDPRWQKLRLEIFERDKWACQKCGDTETTLNIHHRRYMPGFEPWEYPANCLVTMCEVCHESEREEMQENLPSLIEQLQEKFFASDLGYLTQGINNLQLQHTSEVVASAYSWAFSNTEMQRHIIEKYFESIKRK